MRVTLSDNVLLEHVGSDVMVMVPGADQVVALSGESARLVMSLAETGSADLEDSDILDELIRAGVVHPELAAGPSRRGLLVGAAGVAGAGVLALSMPTAAMASSGPEAFGGSLFFTYFFSVASQGAPNTVVKDSKVEFQITNSPAGNLVKLTDRWSFEPDDGMLPKLTFDSLLDPTVDLFTEDEPLVNFAFSGTVSEDVVEAQVPDVFRGTLIRNRGGVLTRIPVSFRNDSKLTT